MQSLTFDKMTITTVQRIHLHETQYSKPKSVYFLLPLSILSNTVQHWFIFSRSKSKQMQQRCIPQATEVVLENQKALSKVITLNMWAATWKNQQSDCAPSENSDQPGHPPSLIRVFAVRMKKAWVLSYPLSAQRRLWSDWVDAQVDMSLRWAHSHFVGFVMSRLIFWLLHNLSIDSKITSTWKAGRPHGSDIVNLMRRTWQWSSRT